MEMLSVCFKISIFLINLKSPFGKGGDKMWDFKNKAKALPYKYMA
jgi:hypothetical protein